MSAICFCGVCIPYSAVLPLLLIVLQYIARPLAKIGLIPEPVAKRLGIHVATATSKAAANDDEDCCAKKSCCGGTTSSSDTKTRTSTTSSGNDNIDEIISEVGDSTEFEGLVGNNELVFVKFTAEWCKPCKQIHPFYHSLAEKYVNNDTKFVTIDVDELDDVAATYKVAMMPTFIALKNGEKIDSMSGANEGKLESFVKRIVE